jgi:type II secretory pathway pseudopilin PulG
MIARSAQPDPDVNPQLRERRPRVRRLGARRKISREGGYVLIAVLFLVVMVLVALSVAAPKMAADIERDREVELVHRGKQYIRAIKLYYKKFHAYPPSVEALENSNNIRFLRKRYKDPMTGKDDWHLIHFGENKTPSYGFFGVPISGSNGSALAGVGPASAAGGAGSTGASGGPLFGGTQLGSSSSSTNSSSTLTSGGWTDPNAGSSGSQTDSGSSGTPGSSSGFGSNSGTGINSGSGSSSGFGSSSSSGFGSNNSNPLTVGGLGIIGVESINPKLGILIWKKKTHYNEWEFWYDPNADTVMVSGNLGAIGQPAGSNGSNGIGSGTSGNGTSGNGTSGTSGGATGGSSGNTGGTTNPTQWSPNGNLPSVPTQPQQ